MRCLVKDKKVINGVSNLKSFLVYFHFCLIFIILQGAHDPLNDQNDYNTDSILSLISYETRYVLARTLNLFFLVYR